MKRIHIQCIKVLKKIINLKEEYIIYNKEWAVVLCN
jgi:hypothetical protein